MKEFRQKNFKKLSFILSISIFITILSYSFSIETPETIVQGNTATDSQGTEASAINIQTNNITNTQIENNSNTNSSNKEDNSENIKTEQQKKLEEHNDIVKKIEDKLKESKDQEEKVDILNKYKNFNLTDQIEQNYDGYKDDKDGDYFQNVDDLDNKYKSKNKKKSKKEIEEDEYNKQWDEKVSKMHAHDLLTLRVDKRDFEVFYEDIEKVPVTITTAFYLDDEKSKIDYEIINTKKKSMFKLKSKNRGFYEFEVTEPGRFEFHLSNERVKK